LTTVRRPPATFEPGATFSPQAESCSMSVSFRRSRPLQTRMGIEAGRVVRRDQGLDRLRWRRSRGTFRNPLSSVSSHIFSMTDAEHRSAMSDKVRRRSAHRISLPGNDRMRFQRLFEVRRGQFVNPSSGRPPQSHVSRVWRMDQQPTSAMLCIFPTIIAPVLTIAAIGIAVPACIARSRAGARNSHLRLLR
jgi:hypothetical protein